MPNAALTALGTYVPERVLTNAELERMVDTTDQWIVERTGIRERRIAGENEFTSDLCERAVRDLMARYGKRVDDVDLVLVCTHTPDFPFPMVSAMLQERLGIRETGAFDLNATCAGFVYGLHLASSLVAAGGHRKVLVLGADSMSRITDYTDRSTCILFGDGAGVALVEAVDEETSAGGNGQSSFLGHSFYTEGRGGHHVYRTSGFATTWNGQPLIDSGKFVQNGREVYRWAVSTIPDGMLRTIASSGLTLHDVDWFVPHSANLRIIESVCEKSGFPLERTLYSLERYGNTSAATIPLSIGLALQDGRIKNGDRLLLYGFGGGLVQAGLLLRWTAEPQ